MYKSKIEEDLKSIILDLGFLTHDILVSISENPKFGDYTTNVALQLAKQKNQNNYQSSQEIANAILEQFGHPPYLQRIEVVGAGFINFFLKDESLLETLYAAQSAGHSSGRILVEYAQPNTHKEFHIGHLRNITIGESVARLLEFQGKKVFRANYGSDIGLPVAKAVWGILQLKDEYGKAKKASLQEKAKFLAKAYTFGHKSYEDEAATKIAIDSLNKLVYAKDLKIIPIWEETRQWSLDYFETIYFRLGTKFDRVIMESEVQSAGKKIVEENIGKVFIKDQGAVIFPGEKYGLHNRVFITSEGNPTYEAKELGVTRREEELFPFDEAIHITGNEQIGYFKVVIQAIELTDKRFLGKKKHLPFGFVTLTTGKMSSRLGNVVTAEDLIDQVKHEITKNFQSANFNPGNTTLETIAVGAIKFAFLKYSLNSDISFDVKQSVSLQGDSGPYLMYAYARIQSLLEKADLEKQYTASGEHKVFKISSLEVEEREILRHLEYFQFIATEAASKFQPNKLAEFILDLAKRFNLFYEKYPVLYAKEEVFRLALAKKVGETLKLGLYLLGIEIVEKM